MGSPLILSIDQGTSSTKCLLVDSDARIVSRGSASLGERHPRPGWVEQDPEQIWTSVREAVNSCVESHPVDSIAAVGISNQRESVVAWDRRTGEPLSPVISWQDRRTASDCDAMRSGNVDELLYRRTGLPLDPMFSALKVKFLLDDLDPSREKARNGEICLGTIDAWILSRFSGRAVIEAGNASRTQLMSLETLGWDDELLALFDIPAACLPDIVSSVGPFPAARDLGAVPDGVPVAAVLGDSHAALFAHGGFNPGRFKATYGTGSSVMGTVERIGAIGGGLCFTVAWSAERPTFAVECNIRSAGATLRWLADLLQLSTEAVVSLAKSVSDTEVSLVPAFNGLGAPWWDRHAVAILSGFSLGTGRASLARAAWESIPHQVADVVEAIERNLGRVDELCVDGAPAMDDDLMQMQADFIGRSIVRSNNVELSALGVAYLAGLRAGVWETSDLNRFIAHQDRFGPKFTAETRHEKRNIWRRSLARARGGTVNN